MRDVEDRDSLLLGLVENVAREQLSPVEEARAYASLVDEFELSLGDVAERVGRSKSAVSNRLRLLELPGGSAVDARPRRPDARDTRAPCSSLPDDDARRRLARRIVKEGLTVRAAERAAQEGGARAAPAASEPLSTRRWPTARERPPSALTGMPARVDGRRASDQFEDEKGLAELVEALEVALDRSASQPSERPTHESEQCDIAAAKPAVRGLARIGIRASGFRSRVRSWAILDSNQGPPPYQSGALTD